MILSLRDFDLASWRAPSAGPSIRHIGYRSPPASLGLTADQSITRKSRVGYGQDQAEKAGLQRFNPALLACHARPAFLQRRNMMVDGKTSAIAFLLASLPLGRHFDHISRS
jgi:hypothetical protein